MSVCRFEVLVVIALGVLAGGRECSALDCQRCGRLGGRILVHARARQLVLRLLRRDIQTEWFPRNDGSVQRVARRSESSRTELLDESYRAGRAPQRPLGGVLQDPCRTMGSSQVCERSHRDRQSLWSSCRSGWRERRRGQGDYLCGRRGNLQCHHPRWRPDRHQLLGSCKSRTGECG